MVQYDHIGMEGLVWEAVQKRYNQGEKKLNSSVVEDMDRFLIEKLLVTYIRVGFYWRNDWKEGEYSICNDILQFCCDNAVAVKATVLIRVLKEVFNSELNPQLQITSDQRKECYSQLYRYINTIAAKCPYNIALPYKLWNSLSTNNNQAVEAYMEKYREGYPTEFLQSYLIDYVLLLLFYDCWYVEQMNVQMIWFQIRRNLLIGY